MASEFAKFLGSCFPSLKKSYQPDCWICRGLRANQSGLGLKSISGAIEVVGRGGHLSLFKQRVQKEHPFDRPHEQQHDDRVIDCFTEALAFAWCHSRRLGNPAFARGDGEPDIRIRPDMWVEAKAINESEENRKQMKDVVNNPEPVTQSIPVDTTFQGLIAKFDSKFADAVRKFMRVKSKKSIIFFHLVELDMDILFRDEEVFKVLRSWAKSKKLDKPEIEAVICYNWAWEAPFLDPYPLH